MKKYIVGFLAGAIFTLSTSVFADDIQSLVGRKVQAESTVSVDGQKLTTIVVEGKNYAPVRSLGEAAGYTVTVEGKDVIMSTLEVKEKYRLIEIENLKKGITQKQTEINELQSLLQAERNKLDTATTDGEKENSAFNIQMYESKLNTAQETLKSAEAQLAELQP